MDLFEYTLILGVVITHQRAILDAEAIAPEMQVAHGFLCRQSAYVYQMVFTVTYPPQAPPMHWDRE